MMRALWCLFVPGRLDVFAIWLAFGLWNVLATPRPPIAAFDLVLAALNLYSWDYQRRHRDGGAS